VDGTTAYVYDGAGQRVRKLVGENTRFVYGIGGGLVAEYDGSSGNLKKEYIAEGITIEPTAVNSNGTQYPTRDHLGSPRVITNSSASVVSRHDYMPFGEELGAGTGGRTTGMGFSGSGDSNRKKFTGYQRDSESGLDYANARYYGNTQGRFTSPDPFAGSATIGNPQTFNRYQYCRNNPVNSVDPSGMAAYSPYASIGKGGEFYQGSFLNKELGIYGDAAFATEWDASWVDMQERARAQENAGRTILIIVGDPGLNEWVNGRWVEHNQGKQFELVAKTKRQELEKQGYTVIVNRASSFADFNKALTSNGVLNGVEYVGHASNIKLYVGEQHGEGTNVDRANVSKLSNSYLSKNAYIKINACFAGYGGEASIAYSIAMNLGRTTIAMDGPTVFSRKEGVRTGGDFRPATGSLYLIPDVGTKWIWFRH
jgi:RHS repeat-associated protein